MKPCVTAAFTLEQDRYLGGCGGAMAAEADSGIDPTCYVLCSAAATATARFAAGGSNGLARVYDATPAAGLEATFSVAAAAPGALADVALLSPVGTTLVALSVDGAVSLWDTRMPPTAATAVLRCGRGGGGDATCVCGSDDMRMVAVGHGSTLKVLDLATRRLLAQYEEAHTEDVTRVEFHPNVRTMLLSSSLDGLICCTDTAVPLPPPSHHQQQHQHQQQQQRHQPHVAAYANDDEGGDEDGDSDAEADDGDSLALVLSVGHPVEDFVVAGASANTLAVITCDEQFSLWSLDSSTSLYSIADDTRQRLAAPDYAPDHLVGSLYDPALSVLHVVSSSGNGAVGLHTLDGRGNLSPAAVFAPRADHGHTALVRTLAAVPGAGLMLTGGEDARVCLWSSATTATTTAAVAVVPERGAMSAPPIAASPQKHILRRSPYARP